MFSPVDPKQSFPKLEEGLMKFWKKSGTFEKSLKKPGGQAKPKDYVFYDGPPFATGLPHYGHLLAGTLKDVVPRYWTMQGYRVPRVWGWDCHGLPIENLIEKELGLKTKKDIKKFGVDKFNEACRASVLKYVHEWEKTVDRMGRWVDMKNAYRTMDVNFMESIWWVFSELHKKGMVYEGHKAMHVCPRCETPISNFEVTLGYKEVKDLSVIWKFPVKGQPQISLLAWTTTPWSTPSTMGLSVGPEFTYVKVKAGDEFLIFAKERLEFVMKNLEAYEVVEEMKGGDLVGLEYEPILDDLRRVPEVASNKNVYHVFPADYVEVTEGTGIVTINGSYGEIDMEAAHKNGLPLVMDVEMTGRFNELLPDYAGMPVKDMERKLVKDLEVKNRVWRSEPYAHSYPHCWRCDTPLMNYATTAWFVRVTGIKDQMLKANETIHWVPDHVKVGRFGKWLENAKDWAVSRTRYWGTPLPIWRNVDDVSDLLVISSVEELEKLSGKKVKDLHKHIVDEVEIGLLINIIYVRHGETDLNKEGRIQGKIDVSLNAKGQSQAKEAAEALKKEKFDLILTSPLKRAMETAQIINESLGIEIMVEDDLRERDFGDWEGKNYKEDLKFKTHDEVRLGIPPHGETFEALKQRLKKVLARYNGKKLLIVSHAHVYLALNQLCTGRTLQDIVATEKIANGIPEKLSYQKTYRRIEEVFDCWFESGSMPYGQWHYPFENKAKLEKNFPANFIAEGLDQTRGWFYTLHVLANALFKKPAFQNVIVNGIVLAENGQKMSKRLKNYPDPNEVLNKYGADALRFYLLNSQAVAAGDLRFSEQGVEHVLRNMMIPLWNAYSFFVTYATIDGWTPKKLQKNSPHKLDTWIIAELEELIAGQIEYFRVYDLQKASNAIYKFVDDLTNWYIRRSRRRFWKSEDDTDKNHAYSTLYTVLTKLCQVLAPFTPFMPEAMYQNLTGEESVHLTAYPTPDRKAYDETLIREIHLAKTIVSLGLAARGKKKIKVRQPLSKIEIVLADPADHALLSDQLETIKEELNVKELDFINDPSEFATQILRPNARLLGPKYGQSVQQIILACKNGEFEILGNGNIRVLDYELTPEEAAIEYLPKEGFDVESGEGILVALDTTLTPELEQEGLARDLVRQIQDLRKTAGYQVSDRITVAISGAPQGLLEKFGDTIKAETLANSIKTDLEKPDQSTDFQGLMIKVKRF